MRISILIEIKSNLKELNIGIKLLIFNLKTIIIIMINAPIKEILNGATNSKEDKNNNFIISKRKFSLSILSK